MKRIIGAPGAKRAAHSSCTGLACQMRKDAARFPFEPDVHRVTVSARWGAVHDRPGAPRARDLADGGPRWRRVAGRA